MANASFNLLALPQELQDNVFEQAVPDQITIIYKKELVDGDSIMAVCLRDPQDFQAITGFLGASKTIRQAAKKAILRATRQKTTLVVDFCDDSRLPSTEYRHHSLKLPIDFYQTCTKLKIRFPITLCPNAHDLWKYNIAKDSHYVGHVEVYFTRKQHHSGQDYAWDLQAVDWHLARDGSKDQRERARYLEAIDDLKQHITANTRDIVPQYAPYNLRVWDLENFRKHFLGENGYALISRFGHPEDGHWWASMPSDDALKDYHTVLGWNADAEAKAKATHS